MTDTQIEVINPAASPVGVNETLENLLNEEHPFPETPETIGKLPGGWLGPDGQIHKDYEVRELTGADEEVLSRVLAKGDDLAQLNWVNRVVILGTVSIGGYPLENSGLDRMLIGDRDALFLAIRRATYGNDYKVVMVCNKCGKESPVAFEMDTDIKYKEIDVEPSYKVNLRKGGVAEVRPLTVAAQRAAMSDSSRTGAEMNTVLLQHSVKSLNGSPTVFPQQLVNMGAGDRRIILEFLNERAPGPLLGEVVAECPKCNQESNISLGMSAMFP